MRWILVVILATSTAWGFDPSEPDKVEHVNVSASLGTTTYTSMRLLGLDRFSSAVLSATMTLAVGHAKESSDEFYDVEDMQANFAGMSAGVIFPVTIDWVFD